MERFINPYTFVPVGKGIKRSISEYYESDDLLISGKIECRLKTRTEMAVCDKTDEKKFDFFSVDGKPVIPGSTIRGVIRNVYEALTDSCFSSTNADDDDYFSSRLNKNECGLLCYSNGQYILYKAKRYKDRSNKQLTEIAEGEKVSFSEDKPGEISYVKNVNKSDEHFGYVHKVDRITNKFKDSYNKFRYDDNLDSVFEKSDENGVVIDEEYVRRLGVNISMSKKKNKRLHEDYEKLYKSLKKGDVMLPVWYCKVGKHYYLASAQMSRSVFFRKPIDFLEADNLEKCSDRKKVCEACALFGMIADEESAISSRLRFSDAECLTADCIEKGYKTVLMGSPRLSSFEFYLRYRGYDYTADTEGVNISGRKFYWHNKNGFSMRLPEKVSDEMKYDIQLLKPGTEFRFNVYFDNITEEQLRKLIFTLDLGDNSIDSRYCHKIGHGKPIGLGSAKIVCENVIVRRFTYPEYREEKRQDLLEGDNSSLFGNQKNVGYIRRVTDFNAFNEGTISYPHPGGRTEIFKWFAENREGIKKIGLPIRFKDKLPMLMDKEQSLPCDHPKENRGGNGYSGNKGYNGGHGGKGGYGGNNRNSGNRGNDRNVVASSGNGEAFNSIRRKEKK